jgi:hypothetical protein
MLNNNPPPVLALILFASVFFLHRDSCRQLAAALKPGGLLFYQTFNTDNQEGPCNPKFVLQRNELLALFAGLEIIAYLENDGQQLSGQSWLVARRR